MPPKKKVPANLAAARKNRHSSAGEPAAAQQSAQPQPPHEPPQPQPPSQPPPPQPQPPSQPPPPPAQQQQPQQQQPQQPSAPTWDDAAAASSSAAAALIPRPRGPTPKVGSVDATWDGVDGCWRGPDGSEHTPADNPKRDAEADARRELCVRIDREAAGEPPRERKGVSKTFTLVVPESCVPLLQAPRDAMGYEYVGPALRGRWYEQVRAIFEAAIDGCEVQLPRLCELHVLRPAAIEMDHEWGLRITSTYWPAVDERLAAAGLSRAQFESCMRAEWAAAMLRAEAELREKRRKLCAKIEAERREAYAANLAEMQKRQREREQARREADAAAAAETASSSVAPPAAEPLLVAHAAAALPACTSAASGGECEAMEVELEGAGVESEDGSDEEVQDEEALLSRAVWRNGFT